MSAGAGAAAAAPPAPRVRRFRRAPWAGWFMARALLPRRPGGTLPALALETAPAVAPAADVEAYRRLTGLPGGDALPPAWPQVWGFRLQMALLTDLAFPLPIWSALQVRNRIQQHAPLPGDAPYALAVRPDRLRRLDKGVEVDLHASLRDATGRLAWESLTTFYWRGRAAAPGEVSPPEAASPAVAGELVARWAGDGGGGWRFAALTGDYNGLHWSDTYARACGFARAFHHPARIAGACLARLAVPGDRPHRLELWIKGPVYYRRSLALHQAAAGDARLFALHVDGDSRPALVGRWVPAGAAAGASPASG